MATTDTRPGFRLPWTTDHRGSPAEPMTTETDETEPQAGAASSDETAGAASPLATDVESTDSSEDPVTPTIAVSTSHETASPVSAPAAGAGGATAPAARQRPTKFLADLTKAMQVAAQAERDATLDQYRADAKAFVEQYRSDAAARATTYRKEADEDVAGIRDWSKAEMSRIREETERRIANRKAELEEELEDHADRIERAVQRVEARIDAYEAEMAAFFERLLQVDDPTTFAAMATSLPEPPPFVPEPLPGDPVPAAAAAAEPVVAVAEPPADVLETTSGHGVADAADPDAPWAGATWSSDPAAADATAAFADDATADADATAVAADADATAVAEPATEPIAGSPVEATGTGHLPAGLTEQPVDPRLEALGLTPDFAAAEAEAAVDLASGDGSDDADGVEEVGDDTVAARIAGLVPAAGDPALAPSGETRSTQVVVVGLVSVASIAGFKRQLARVPGVQSVSVSSGPDGEFVFTTTHHDEVAIPAAIATLPGFDARVTASGDGIVHVASRDPESEG